MATTVYQMVTDRIIEQINKGIVPWHKPWHFAGNASTSEDVAINYVSRKPYSLLNQWLLMEPGEYITFTQIKGLGGNLKKGAKSRFVVFFTKATYKKIDPETNEEKEETYPLLRYYNVYRLADTEGIKSKLPAPGEAPEIVETPAMSDEADAAIAAYIASQAGLTFQNDKPSDRAYYSLHDDKVVVPMRSQFTEMAEYYSTAFHELTHSTLTEGRCNRRQVGEVAFFGSKSYSREELVAEMGAAMLCSNFGVDTDKAFCNSVAYLQSWVANLKNDPKAIVVAASRAEKAARYILGERETAQA